MAARKKKPKADEAPELVLDPPRPLWRRALRLVGRAVLGVAAFYLFLILLFSFVPPPRNIYQWQEAIRLGGIERDWVPFDQIAPEMARSVVAAEDANFCLHWGFDIDQIRAAIADGQQRGASTISQQVVKNVFLWHGRSYTRKAMEALLTPVVELVWSKQRILEVYLNNAEMAEGVFGVGAAARELYDTDAASLTAKQAARLAAVLPNPKEYDAANPGNYVRGRAAQIISGAETIAADGRAACFETLD